MNEWTPNTESIRDAWTSTADEGDWAEWGDAFDRWLAKHDAELLRQQARGLSWFGAQGNTVEPNTAWAGVQACMTALNRKANELDPKESL